MSIHFLNYFSIIIQMLLFALVFYFFRFFFYNKSCIIKSFFKFLSKFSFFFNFLKKDFFFSVSIMIKKKKYKIFLSFSKLEAFFFKHKLLIYCICLLFLCLLFGFILWDFFNPPPPPPPPPPGPPGDGFILDVSTDDSTLQDNPRTSGNKAIALVKLTTVADFIIKPLPFFSWASFLVNSFQLIYIVSTPPGTIGYTFQQLNMVPPPQNPSFGTADVVLIVCLCFSIYIISSGGILFIF